MARARPARAPSTGAAAQVALASLLAAAAAALVMFLWAGPAGAGGTPEFVAGDLIVGPGETQVLQNRTLVVTGNVTVAGGASLELRNASLLFNLTANGSFALVVEAGGSFRALDLDGSPQTVSDRSEVASANLPLRYTAHFKALSNVTVRNSVLSGFGYSLASPGLLIESDAVLFERATLQTYVYLRVQGASPRFEGTLFVTEAVGSNYFFASSSVLAGCTFERHFVALSASEGSNLTVSGALIRDSTFAVAANGARVGLSGSTVNNSSSGLFMTNGSLIEALDVAFDPAAVTFGDANSTLVARRAFVFVVLNQANEGARGAQVSVANATGVELSAGAADASGEFGPVALLAFVMTGAGRVDEGNFSVAASKSGNSTSYGFSAFDEPSPVLLLVPSNLDPRLTLVSPATGAILLAGAPAAFAVNVSDPDGTPGGLSVSWVSSIQGPLGSGAALTAALVAGNHTVTVEVHDTAGGLREFSFALTVEAGRLETYATATSAGNAVVSIWKASPGGLLLFSAPPSPRPLLAVGDALEVRPASGYLEWGSANLTVPYSAYAVPYGVPNTSLRLHHVEGGVWVEVPGSSVDLANRTVKASVLRSGGLGAFLIVGTKGPNLPPDIEPIERLVAVRGQAFSYTVAANDTPGDVVRFTLEGAPAWLSIDASTGILSGSPGPSDRGLVSATVVATDGEGANSSAPLEVFVTGTLENRLPVLANPQFVPAHPYEGDTVSIQITYYDADDDLPVLLEVVVDGVPHSMDPVNLFDITASDGKDYVWRDALPAGSHTVAFRVNDGFAGHPDLTPVETTLAVSFERERQLNNWFLALFASVALALLLMVYFSATAKPPPARSKEPEAYVSLIEGEALTPIAPPAPPPQEPQGEPRKEGGKAGGKGEASSKGKAPPADREAELEREAEALAKEAEADEQEAKEAVEGAGKD